MVDYLAILAETARGTINEGYYDVRSSLDHGRTSLREAILRCKGKNPIIAELKFASPSRGKISPVEDPIAIGKAMEKGGAIALSVLTEPKHFQGSLETFAKVRERLSLPLLFKDIVLSSVQIETASKVGADVILLILSVFRRGLAEGGLDEMIAKAHSSGLEVLVETHGEDEFSTALSSKADMVGINSRNLETMRVDLEGIVRIMKKFPHVEKVVIAESGIGSASEVSRLKRYGVRGFLVGTSIMASGNVEKKVRELVYAV